MPDTSRISEAYKASAVQFIHTELDLGLTFCQVGLTTSERSNAVRNLANAKEALASALCFQERLTLTATQRHEFEQKLSLLRSLLALRWSSVSAPPQRLVCPSRAA